VTSREQNEHLTLKPLFATLQRPSTAHTPQLLNTDLPAYFYSALNTHEPLTNAGV
jgi:hypothetical protein